jgi:hypothetical protein
MPWRTEPEIDAGRQQVLAARRAVTPDIEMGTYPFKDIDIRLMRADVEWLLATHEDGRGPVDWSDPRQRGRDGLDVRGASLQGALLHGLPLARLRAGLAGEDWHDASAERQEWAAAHLEGANLIAVHLEGATLNSAHLEGAVFQRSLKTGRRYAAHLEEADLRGAHLEGADLRVAHLEGAVLRQAHLEGRHLCTDERHRVRQRVNGCPEALPPALLQRAFFDATTTLDEVILGTRAHGFVSLADVRWGGVNLAVVHWDEPNEPDGLRHRRPRAVILGEEREARRPKDADGTRKPAVKRLEEFEAAVRVNRQLATVLRGQGLNDNADRFAYRAQVIQRQVLRRRRRWLRYCGALLLDLISGHGYRPLRAFLAYAVVILGFAGLYLLNGQFVAPHLTWNEALVLSMSSFHGRGFFSSHIALGDTYAELAAGEAFIGLLIEITLIATFTQRFFAR